MTQTIGEIQKNTLEVIGGLMKKQIIVLSLIFAFCFSSFGFANEWHIPEHASMGDVIKHPAINYETWNEWNECQKYAFIFGFLMGYLNCPPSNHKDEFFDKIGGMTLTQVVDTVDKFYRDHPEVRDRYHLFKVILSVLPRYRSGDKPID